MHELEIPSSRPVRDPTWTLAKHMVHTAQSHIHTVKQDINNHSKWACTCTVQGGGTSTCRRKAPKWAIPYKAMASQKTSCTALGARGFETAHTGAKLLTRGRNGSHGPALNGPKVRDPIAMGMKHAATRPGRSRCSTATGTATGTPAASPQQARQRRSPLVITGRA